MPFPRPDHPQYCPGSLAARSNPDDRIWLRCEACHRLIAPRADGRLFPHLNHPTRRNDAVQETLDAYGQNRRTPAPTLQYAEE